MVVFVCCFSTEHKARNNFALTGQHRRRRCGGCLRERTRLAEKVTCFSLHLKTKGERGGDEGGREKKWKWKEEEIKGGEQERKGKKEEKKGRKQETKEGKEKKEGEKRKGEGWERDEGW